MSNVVSLAAYREDRQSIRLTALHYDHRELSELRAEGGSADDWLWSAVDHFKCAFCESGDSATAIVSKAAISIIIGKLEELLVSGSPWVPGEKWA